MNATINKCITGLSTSGTTVTYIKSDSSTGTITTQDTDTTYSAGNGLSLSNDTFSVSYGASATELGTSSAGSASTVSRSDHVHALPALTSCTGTLTVAKGGTGATTAAGACENLGAYPQADMVFATGGIEQTTSIKFDGENSL